MMDADESEDSGADTSTLDDVDSGEQADAVQPDLPPEEETAPPVEGSDDDGCACTSMASKPPTAARGLIAMLLFAMLVTLRRRV